MKCIICNGSTWEYLFPVHDRMFGIAGKFSEYRCKRCGLVRLSPKLSETGVKKYYPSASYYSYSGTSKPTFFGNLRSYLITHRWSRFFIRVPAIPEGNPGRILDVGCGSGSTLVLLRTLGWDVFGLDIDKQAIRAARKRGLTNVSLGSYEDAIKYPDNYFDVIRLYHVIEHLGEPERCLRLIYKKLKRGGQILIGTPNVSSIIPKLFGPYWYNLDAPRHLYLFSPKTLSILLKRCSYTDAKVRFASAGGWVGSMQYVISERTSHKAHWINIPWLVILLYPLEWLLDRFGLGDVFVVSAMK